VAFGVKKLREQTKKNLKRRPPFFRYFEYQVWSRKRKLSSFDYPNLHYPPCLLS
jgi:hypothetical protein